MTGSDAPPRTPLKFFYDIVSIIALQCSLNYTVVPFILMDVKPTLLAWYRLGFYGHVLCFVPFAFFTLGGGVPLRRELKRREGIRLKEIDKQVDKQSKDGAALQIPATTQEAAQDAVKQVKKEL